VGGRRSCPTPPPAVPHYQLKTTGQPIRHTEHDPFCVSPFILGIPLVSPLSHGRTWEGGQAEEEAFLWAI